MATQNRLHVLVQDKTRPDQAAEAEHEREQPDNARDRRLIGKLQLELGEVDLRLVAGRRFESNFKVRQWSRPKLTQHIGDGGIATLISALAKLPQQSTTGQARIGHHALAQIQQQTDRSDRLRGLRGP